MISLFSDHVHAKANNEKPRFKQDFKTSLRDYTTLFDAFWKSYSGKWQKHISLRNRKYRDDYVMDAPSEMIWEKFRINTLKQKQLVCVPG